MHDLELRSGRQTVPIMANKFGNGTSPIVQSVKNRQREQQVFSGNSEDDFDDWLRRYGCVSNHNNWDNTVKLANVVFFFERNCYQLVL